MYGRRGRAVMAVPPACDQCTEAAHLVQANLAAIGIDVEIRQVDPIGKVFKPAAFDLIDAESAIPYPDSASFLRQVLRDTPPGWAPARARVKIQRVAHLNGDGRQAAAAALADRLATNDVLVAAYAIPQTSQVIGARIGCRVFSPFAYGLDLATMCVKGS
jgi:hypothetical protein